MPDSVLKHPLFVRFTHAMRQVTLPLRRAAWLLPILAALAAFAPPSVLGDDPVKNALHAAAAANDPAAIADLLARGEKIDAGDERGRSALLVATYLDNVEAARALIAAGADVNAKDDREDSPYLYAAAEGRTEILKLTLAAGADLTSTNRYGGTGLIPAAHHEHPEAVRELLQTAIDVDHVNKLGWTALLEVMILGDGSSGYIEITRMLVDAGADVNFADKDGVTPLAHARRQGFQEIIAILEKAGARP